MASPVISIAQMREWEQATWASGQTEAEVIRRVGIEVARHAALLTRGRDRILVLAGRGHNGDDARAALAHLSDRRVELLEIQDPRAAGPGLDAALSREPALVIDGLFGIGLNRALDSAWAGIIQRLNAAQLRILAVDVPSGLNADSGEPHGASVVAAVTLTVGAPKKGLLAQTAWPYVGRLEVATEVGLVPCSCTSDLWWTLPGDFAGFPPRRSVAGHKGTHGHLAILAGSVGYHGAAVLAARGAQRARPGLISLFTHEPAYRAVAGQLQAVMVHPWMSNMDVPGKFTAILVGPGLAAASLPEDMALMAQRWWADGRIPMIVDASALDWLTPGSAHKGALRVITPHPGEASRLLRTTSQQIQANRFQAVRDLSQNLGECWIVLKGHQTLVGRRTDRVFANCSGNPYLAQGGAGDLLSGYLAGLLAQPALQADPLQTIRFGVWEHGAAADRLQASRQNWTVDDLAEELGRGGS